MKRLVAAATLLALLTGCREVRVKTYAHGTTNVPGGNQIAVVRSPAQLEAFGVKAPVKFNHQIDERSETALACQRIVTSALERNPLFISSVLPNTVYPPMFNRYGKDMRFGAHVDGSVRICEIVEYGLEDVIVKGAWTGPAALELHQHALAPVAELPVLEVVSAVHILADLTLGLGKVVHDYLR